MKRGLLVVLGVLLAAACFGLVACGNVDANIVGDAVTVSNLKKEVGQAFDTLSNVEGLAVDSDRGVVSFSVANEVSEIDLSALKITSGTLLINNEAPSVLTLDVGENTFSVSAVGGTISVGYNLKITRKTATPSGDQGGDPVVTPTHTHTYSDAWSKDADYHWHAATCEHATEVKDKAAHEWDLGEITTPATEESDGVKTFTCTVCGATKTEAVPQLVHIHT